MALLGALAVLGPVVVATLGLNPDRPDILHALAPPSARHWFGTDLIGRDLFARVVIASRLDLAMAFAAVILSACVGGALGAGGALLGGAPERLLQRTIDVAMAFPLFVVALALAAVFGNSVGSVVLATALINLPFYVRLAGAEVGVRLHAPYVGAARLAGWSDARILARVLLPNVLPSLIVQMSVNLGWAMLNGAGLSFVGLGIRPPTAEWGVLVGEGARFMMTGQWWLATFPGLALCSAVFALTLAGDRLRDHFDPRRR
ncbi:ABC transporter permease [Robbsia sp. Bb-Pol-6]|uniref:ABC transporter permease n=1 Tax=Robbsia betulipollinis TaxID=2981849 RepID=A0ABT3ZGR1_9BURK|nr:ABC transporter permease [Robbsia betulipollinis]MCY0385711.1 ABC transporter permease [Robbsia betulipollinis]